MRRCLERLGALGTTLVALLVGYLGGLIAHADPAYSSVQQGVEADEVGLLSSGVTSWLCAQQCKYARAAIKWDVGCHGWDYCVRTVIDMRWIGGFDSPPCVGDNTVTRWRAYGGYVKRHATGVTIKSVPSGPWRYNCQMGSQYIGTTNAGEALDLRAQFNYCHQDQNTPANNFPSRTNWRLTGSGPVAHPENHPGFSC